MSTLLMCNATKCAQAVRRQGDSRHSIWVQQTSYDILS